MWKMKLDKRVSGTLDTVYYYFLWVVTPPDARPVNWSVTKLTTIHETMQTIH